MPSITSARITALGTRVPLATATGLARALEAHRAEYGLTSLLEVAHFMAQVCHETGGFLRLEENLNYRDPKRLDDMFLAVRGTADAAALIQKGPKAIANRVYANRNGNGPEISGDGWNYRGRGLIQLTGRDNYAAAAWALERPYIAEPDLVAQPEDAARTALWFWKENGCGRYAKLDDVAGVTRIINGKAMAGLEDRRELTEKAKRIFV